MLLVCVWERSRRMREARVEARWKDTRYAAVYVMGSSGGSLEPKSGR